MATPGERIRDAVTALGEALESTVGVGGQATESQQLQFRADLWDAVAAGCVPRSAELALSADQTSLVDDDILEFDTLAGQLVDDGLVAMTTDGEIELSQGHRYLCIPGIRPTLANNVAAVVRAYWKTAAGGNVASFVLSGVEPQFMRWHPSTFAGTTPGESHSVPVIFDPSGADLTVVLEFDVDQSGNQIRSGSRLSIIEVL